MGTSEAKRSEEGLRTAILFEFYFVFFFSLASDSFARMENRRRRGKEEKIG